jgi:Tfp pilus assembly protein FimV
VNAWCVDDLCVICFESGITRLAFVFPSESRVCVELSVADSVGGHRSQRQFWAMETRVTQLENIMRTLASEVAALKTQRASTAAVASAPLQQPAVLQAASAVPTQRVATSTARTNRRAHAATDDEYDESGVKRKRRPESRAPEQKTSTTRGGNVRVDIPCQVRHALADLHRSCMRLLVLRVDVWQILRPRSPTATF